MERTRKKKQSQRWREQKGRRAGRGMSSEVAEGEITNLTAPQKENTKQKKRKSISIAVVISMSLPLACMQEGNVAITSSQSAAERRGRGRTQGRITQGRQECLLRSIVELVAMSYQRWCAEERRKNACKRSKQDCRKKRESDVIREAERAAEGTVVQILPLHVPIALWCLV